jgi:membrane-associated phospholipid phosphatase
MAGLVLLPVWLADAALGLGLVTRMGLSRLGYEAIIYPLVIVGGYVLGPSVAHVVARCRPGRAALTAVHPMTRRRP